MTGSPAPAEPEDAGLAPRGIPDPGDVRRLLQSYQGLIDEAGRAGREAPPLRRVITYGTEGFAVEHVRRALVTLDRRYRAPGPR